MDDRDFNVEYTILQSIVAPTLSGVMGDKKLLSVALFATFIQVTRTI